MYLCTKINISLADKVAAAGAQNKAAGSTSRVAGSGPLESTAL